ASAHDRPRRGRERGAGDRARREVAGGGEMSRLVLAALSHIKSGAGTLFDRGERDGGDVAAARLPGVDTTVELDGGIDAWQASGRDIATVPLAPVEQSAGPALDVRQRSEYESGHLPAARNLAPGAVTGAALPPAPRSIMCGR